MWVFLYLDANCGFWGTSFRKFLFSRSLYLAQHHLPLPSVCDLPHVVRSACTSIWSKRWNYSKVWYLHSTEASACFSKMGLRCRGWVVSKVSEKLTTSTQTQNLELQCPLDVRRDSDSLGLDSLGFEPRWWRDFDARPDRSRGPSSLLCNGYRIFFRG